VTENASPEVHFKNYVTAVQSVGLNKLSESAEEQLDQFFRNTWDKEKFLEKFAKDSLYDQRKQLEFLIQLQERSNYKEKYAGQFSQNDVMDIYEFYIDKLQGLCEKEKFGAAWTGATHLLNLKVRVNMERFKDKIQGVMKSSIANVSSAEATGALLENAPKIRITDREKIFNKFPGNLIYHEFQQKVQPDIQEGSSFGNKKFLDLFRMFSLSQYSDFEMQNSFIMGFGQNYERFNNNELVNFCVSLKMSGLRQEDIYNTVMQTLKDVKDPRERDFNTLFMPMLTNMMHMEMKGLVTEWESVVD